MLLNPFDDRSAQVKTKIAVTYALLITANLAAWIWAVLAFSDRPVLLVTAALAYMFGLRHAFDADHIAAIDNVVRKLIQDGKAPFSVGLFFSLGHSTIVVLASLAIAAAALAMQNHLDVFHNVGGLIGTGVSALFLLGIGIANLFILKSIWSVFVRAHRRERIIDEEFDALLAGRGLFARLFRSIFRIVSRSWHMYPVGFLFRLGFDTATEIGLLGISAEQAAKGMSFFTILVFPALFTAGMSFMDTSDSVLMNGAYGWAFVHPIRKIWYNLTITAASVLVAIFIGGVEALGFVGEELHFKGAVWISVRALNDNLANFGFAVVAIFIASWVVSTAVYHAAGFANAQASNISELS